MSPPRFTPALAACIFAASCAGPAVPPAEAKFRAAVAAFADEAEALARYLGDAPEPGLYRAKFDRVSDLASRIPDEPAGRDDVRSQVRAVVNAFAYGGNYLGFASRASTKDSFARNVADCRRIAAEQKPRLKAIEQYLGSPR